MICQGCGTEVQKGLDAEHRDVLLEGTWGSFITHGPTRCHAADPVRRLVQFILVNEDKFTEYDPDGVKKHTLAALRAEMEKP